MRARTDNRKPSDIDATTKGGTHSVPARYGNAHGYEVVTLLEQQERFN